MVFNRSIRVVAAMLTLGRVAAAEVGDGLRATDQRRRRRSTVFEGRGAP